MRQILLLLLFTIFFGFSNNATGQTKLIYKSSIDAQPDSAAMLRTFRKRVDSLTQVIQKTFDPRTLAGLHVDRGIGEAALGHPDSAIHDYSIAITLNPQLKDVFVFRAVQYERIKNYEAGIADLEKVLTFSNDSPVRTAFLYGSIGFMQRRLKNYAKALEADSIALVLNPNYGFARIDMGWAHLLTGKYAQAIDDFTTGMMNYRSTKKTMSSVLVGQGDAERYLKKYKNAINTYSRALEMDPDNKRALWNRAACYNQNGDYELADIEYTKTIPYYKGDSTNLAMLYDDRALMEIGEQKYKAALHDDSLALRFNNKYPEAYWNIATAHAQNGEFQLSIDWYFKAMNYYRDSKLAQSAIYDAIANEDYFLAKYDQVIETSTSAIALNASSWSPYLNRGRAYLKKMKNNLAVADFNKVLEKDTAKRSYEYAFALFYTGNADKAIQVMQNNAIATTNNAMLISHYYNIACLYSLMNKPDEANVYLKKCIDGGYSKKYAQSDPDLENIRKTREFEELMTEK